MPEALKLGFAGTPAFAETILRGLIEAGRAIQLVLTQPDRPTGRGRKLTPSPVRRLAESHGIEVRTPASLKGASLAEDALDLLIVAAYGLILPAPVLDSPRYGCLNVHASLLPRWRGAAPVERAIMAGDAETGVCLMRMERGLDTGPVYDRARLTIGAAETGSELETRLADLGSRLLLDRLDDIPRMIPEPQPEQGITYAHKLEPGDSRLDWTEGAAATARRIRALTQRQPVTVYARDPAAAEPVRVRLLGALPAKTAATAAAPGTVLSISRAGLELACADGSVQVQAVQLNRGKGTPMTPKAAANGYPELFAPGVRLLSIPDPAA